MAKQENLIPKTESEINQEFTMIMSALRSATGLPSTAVHCITVLSGFSQDQLAQIIAAAKVATPRIRQLGQLAGEIALDRR